MRLITPDFGLLFWMLVSFAIVFFVLAKWGFPIITRMVDKRRKYIDDSLGAAREANERLAGIEEESKRLIADAERRQAEIVRNAAEQSKQIIEQARNEAQAQTTLQMENATKQIDIMRRRALGDLRAEVAMLSVEVAEKVLRADLSDKARQEQLIDRLIDETNVKSNDKTT